MKTCLACGRQSSDAEVNCPHCGAKLPTKADHAPETLAQIDFLLAQLDTWVSRGEIPDEQARKLRADYLDRRDRIQNRGPITLPYDLYDGDAARLSGGSAKIKSPQPGRSQSPFSPQVKTGAGSYSPLLPREGPGVGFESGIGDAALSYWQAIGVALVLAGLVGMVALNWSGRHMGWVVGTLITLDFALFAALTLQAVSRHPITRGAVTIAALLMVPLEAIGATRIAFHPWHWAPSALLAAVALLAASAIATRALTSRSVTFLLAAATGLVFWLAASMLLTSLVELHATGAAHAGAIGAWRHSPGSSMSRFWRSMLSVRSADIDLARAQVSAFFVLAGIYFVAGARSSEEDRRRIWLCFGHGAAAIAVTYGFAASTGLGVLGPATLALAFGAAVYAAGSALYRSPWLATAAVIGALSSILLALAWRHVSLVTGWWWYALWVNALALVLTGLARLMARLGASDFESRLLLLSQGAAVLAAAPQVAVIAVCAFTLADFKPVTGHVWGALFSAIATLIVLRPVARPIMTGIWIGYIGILFEFLISCYAPKATFLHTQPHAGLGLAVTAAFFLWALKQRDEARWCNIAALAASIVYAALGGYVAATLLALALTTVLIVVDALMVSSRRRGGLNQADAILGSVTLTLFVLLADSILLPYLHARCHLVNNAGYGLIPLSLIFAALSVWLRREQRILAMVMRYAAVVVAVVTVVMQFGYVLHDGFVRSPIGIMQFGVFVCGLIAIFGRSDLAGTSTIAICVLTTLLWALTPHALYSPRESSLIWTVLYSAVVFTVLSVRERRGPWTNAACLFLLFGLIGAMHRVTGAPPAGYVALVGIYDMILLAVALKLRAVDEDDVWSTPMASIAIITACAALAPMGAQLVGPAPPAEYRVDLVSQIVMLATFAALAWTYGRELYVALTAVVATCVWLLIAQHLDPKAPIAGLAVDISYAALIQLALGWIGTGPSGAMTPSPYRFLLSGLLKSAIGVSIFAVVLALWGLGDSPGRYALYATLIMGVVCIGSGAALWNGVLDLVGKVAFGLAYFVYAVMRIQHPGVPISDWYLVTVGVFSLVVAALGSQMRPQAASAGLVAGALLCLSAPLSAIWAPHPPVYLAPIVAVEAVIFVYWGLASRLLWLNLSGSVALVALIALSAAGHTRGVHWSVFAAVLGVVVVGSAMIIERRKASNAMAAVDAHSVADS